MKKFMLSFLVFLISFFIVVSVIFTISYVSTPKSGSKSGSTKSDPKFYIVFSLEEGEKNIRTNTYYDTDIIVAVASTPEEAGEIFKRVHLDNLVEKAAIKEGKVEEVCNFLPGSYLCK